MAGTHRHLIRIIAVVLVWSTVPQAAYGWSLFGPKTYNECVLDKIKDANNTAAVMAVKQSCRKLFPLKKVVLPSSAVKNITISDAEFTGQSLQMTLHNNNHDWTVTNFLIVFSETGGKAGTVTPTSSTPPVGTVGTVFEMDEMIASYGKSTVYLNLEPNKAYKLWLSGVKGYQ